MGDEQIWVLTLDRYLAGGDKVAKGIAAQTTFGEVEKYLKAMGLPAIRHSRWTLIGGTEDKDIASTVIRRRLSPGETFLKNLRRVKPFRDSPVLTRLLKEIRELNRQ